MGRVREACPGAAVHVVDDGSGDDTAARAEAAGAAVVRLGTNHGKGRALTAGLEAALANPAALRLVTLDADGQHPPEAIPALLAPLEAGAADLVVGARPRRATEMPLARRGSNWLSSRLMSRALGVTVPDSQSGFRAMSRAVAERVRPAGRRYEYETEFLFAAAAHGFRIAAVEVPTVYAGAQSHFRYLADTLAVARVYARHWRPILTGPRPR